jgi:hypothetical protein
MIPDPHPDPLRLAFVTPQQAPAHEPVACGTLYHELFSVRTPDRQAGYDMHKI